MSKSIIGVAAALALSAGALSACGSDDGGAGGDTVIVGAFSPLSGPAVSASSGIKATEAAIKKVNDAGGIDGVKIEYIVKDDQFNPANTPGVARQLVETDQAVFLCGPQGSVPFGAVKDYLAQKKIPTIVNAGAPALAGEYAYLASSPFDGMGALLAQFSLEDLDAKSVAVVYSDDILGVSSLEGAEAIMEENGKELAAKVKFDLTGTDFSAQAIQLKASGADVVLMPSAQANTAGPIINAAEKLGYKPIWGLSYSSQNKTLVELTKGAIDGRAYFVTPYITTESEIGAEYSETLQKYAPEVEANSGATIAGYTIGEMCVEVLKQAVEEAGGAPSAADIQKVMDTMQIDSDYIKGIDWTPDEHGGAKAAQVLKLEGGKYIEFKPSQPLPDVS